MTDNFAGKIEQLTQENKPLCGLELPPEIKMRQIVEKSSAALWTNYTDKKQECEKYREALILIAHARYNNLDDVSNDDIYRIANDALTA